MQDKRGFHLGTLSNIQEVFGDNKLLWFFPIPTYLGDGIVFPQRSTYCQNDEEMGCAEPTVNSRFEVNKSFERTKKLIT